MFLYLARKLQHLFAYWCETASELAQHHLQGFPLCSSACVHQHFEDARPVVRWFNQQSFYKGYGASQVPTPSPAPLNWLEWSIKSHCFGKRMKTSVDVHLQTTIMVYQAVAEYWTHDKEPQYNLNVNLTLPERSEPMTINFNKNNKLNTRTTKVRRRTQSNTTRMYVHQRPTHVLL